MATTNNGEITVLVDTPLPSGNPRGITSDWLTWNVEQNLPSLSTGGGINWTIIGAGAALALGLILVLKRR
jgi:hypothetical protein